VEDAAELLAKLGHDVTPAALDVNGVELAKDFMDMWCAEAAATMRELEQSLGAAPTDFELDNRLLAASARGTLAADYLTSHRRWNVYPQGLAKFHETYDLLLTPTLAKPPVRIGELDAPRVVHVAGSIMLRLGLVPLMSRSKLWSDTVLSNLGPVPYTQLA